ncbi:MAG: FtsW/RodA/SpoVE family cell cycle protein [Clostridiales bacterium]|jgi:rod shape determining protein RodA|nr:FtsW/RodA/SpoVE family cell cycle protein [Clostridiales bacterium]
MNSQEKRKKSKPVLKEVDQLTIRRQWRSFDFTLLILVCGFAAFGIVMVGTVSAGAFAGQRLFYITGIILLIAAALIDYHLIANFYIPIYLLMILLLLILIVIGPDQDTGTARWIPIGPVSIQPSEFGKIFMIVFLSKLIDKKKEIFNNVFVLLGILALIVIPVLMVARQPSLSASLVIVALSICILFGAQIKFRYIAGGLALAAMAAAFLYWDWQNPEHLVIDKILGPYQMKRIITFSNPDAVDDDASFQIKQSLQAIGSGMLGGKGLRKGAFFIPAATNDFIFSALAEKLGFIGCAAVLAAIFLIITKCILIANRATDTLGRLIAIGVAGMLAFEVVVNVGVATAILPNTGMPFPFLSSGGSAMWVHMAAIGLVLNVGLFKTKSIFKG